MLAPDRGTLFRLMLMEITEDEVPVVKAAVAKWAAWTEWSWIDTNQCLYGVGKREFTDVGEDLFDLSVLVWDACKGEFCDVFLDLNPEEPGQESYCCAGPEWAIYLREVVTPRLSRQKKEIRMRIADSK